MAAGELVLIVLILASVIAWAKAAGACIRGETVAIALMKWLLVITCAPLVGPLVYLVWRRPQLQTRQ